VAEFVVPRLGRDAVERGGGVDIDDLRQIHELKRKKQAVRDHFILCRTALNLESF
jgi:hypothetical protein